MLASNIFIGHSYLRRGQQKKILFRNCVHVWGRVNCRLQSRVIWLECFFGKSFRRVFSRLSLGLARLPRKGVFDLLAGRIVFTAGNLRARFRGRFGDRKMLTSQHSVWELAFKSPIFILAPLPAPLPGGPLVETTSNFCRVTSSLPETKEWLSSFTSLVRVQEVCMFLRNDFQTILQVYHHFYPWVFQRYLVR